MNGRSSSKGLSLAFKYAADTPEALGAAAARAAAAGFGANRR